MKYQFIFLFYVNNDLVFFNFLLFTFMSSKYFFQILCIKDILVSFLEKVQLMNSVTF